MCNVSELLPNGFEIGFGMEAFSDEQASVISRLMAGKRGSERFEIPGKTHLMS